jgi:hypothetical protein
MLTITSVIIVLSLLFGGTGAAVVAAQDSMPGEALYTLKIAGEDFQFKFINNDEERLEKALYFATRRDAEATAMAGNGVVTTNQGWTSLAERLEKNLKDALLAAVAMEDPEAGLTKLRTHVFMWEEDYKRLQDGLPEDAPAHQVRNVFRNTRMIVDEVLENPFQFQAADKNRFGRQLEETDLLATAGEGDILSGEPPVDNDPQGQQTQSGSAESYGPGQDEAQFAPNNAGDTSQFEFKGDGAAPYGPGETSGNGSNTQTQSGNNYQYKSDSTENQNGKP